jgi:hypothetical protein
MELRSLTPVFGGRVGGAMRGEFDMDQYIATSLAELKEKQELLGTTYGIGHHASFWFDQPSGTLEFRDAKEQPHLTTDILPIGSYSPKSGTWMWAWANNSILPVLRERAGCFRELAKVTGVQLLAQDMINVEPDMPWEITAMAVHHIGAMGAYRAPGRASDLYLAIIRVTPVTPS